MKEDLKVPKNLKESTKSWIKKINHDYFLESHHQKLLILAGQAWDEAQASRKVIDKDGPVYLDRFQQPKKRPEVEIEADARIAFCRIMRELSLSEEPPDNRPPALKYGGR